MNKTIAIRSWLMAVFAFCLQLILAVCGPIAASAEEDKRSPLIEVPNAVVDLGKVEEGEVLTTCFGIYNVGEETLQIHNVKTACDCTRANYPRDITPGGRGEICLSIDTLGFNGLSKFKIAVYCSDPSRSVIPLHARAQISPMVTLIPERFFFKAMAGSELQQEVRVETKGPHPLNISLESHDLGDKITVDLVPTAAGKKYRLTVRNRILTAGSYRGRILLSSDHPGRKRIVVPVFAHLTPPVAVYPSRMVLDTKGCHVCRAKGLYKGHLLVRSHDRKPLRILFVRPEQPGLTWDIKTMIPDAAYRLDVRYSSADAPPPPSEIIIGIDRTDREALVVPLSLK